VASLIRAGEQTKYISLDILDTVSGKSVELDAGDERVVVIFSGRVEVIVDGQSLGIAGGRADVFDGPGDAVYLPPTSTAVLLAIGRGHHAEFTAAVAAAAAGAQPPGAARMIPGAAQREVEVGRDSWGRTVRTILGPDDPASRLIVGETIHMGTGTWSTFPPHRHDRESPEEVQPAIDKGDVIVGSGQTDIKQTATAGWKAENAQSRMDSLLTSTYNGDKKLDGVLSPNDTLARAIITSVKGAGKALPTVTGQDSEVESVKSIERMDDRGVAVLWALWVEST